MLTALTGLRAVAAIGVVVSHSGVPASLPEHLGRIASWGHIGVPMFFMLSGVVLAYNYPDLRGWEGRCTIRFYIARIARVMPLYWAVIAYCAVYLWAYGRPNHGWALLQNLLAVQTWSGDLKVAMGYYNSPGWSIGVELFFYALFPFLVPLVASLARRSGARGLILLILAMTAVILTLWAAFHLTGHSSFKADNPASAHRWLYRNPLCHLPMFVVGMAVAFLIPYTGRWSTGRHQAIQAFVFSYVFGLAAFRPMGSGWSSAAYGLLFVVPFALVMISLASGRGWMARILSTTVMVRLGLASYALYLTHRWILFDLGTADRIRTGGGWAPYGALLITLAVLLLIAEGAHQYIEEPARRLLVRFTRRWTSGGTSHAAPTSTTPGPGGPASEAAPPGRLATAGPRPSLAGRHNPVDAAGRAT
ncbi:acyltransferase [Actinoplanes philippinensis]|uniref:acyltransferase family protein n=1 Tax=Actinoplanes philippinensis TaxID=35752 RepID=UPI0015A5E615|nr:acyltransferase [Actinoplanes philippinensis]GIE74775.1 acyltransferase [Actinoplanes philippinensis]